MTRGEWCDTRSDPFDDAHEEGCDGGCVRGLCDERARLLEAEADGADAAVDARVVSTVPVCAMVNT
jgi:hypothetical protein